MPRISDQELADYTAAYQKAWPDPLTAILGVGPDLDRDTELLIDHVQHNCMLDLLYDLADARGLLATLPDPLAPLAIDPPPLAIDQPPIDPWPVVDLSEHMTLRRMAVALGLSAAVVKRHRAAGRLNAVPLGHGWFVTRDEALAYARWYLGPDRDTPRIPPAFDPVAARAQLLEWAYQDEENRLPWKPNIRIYHAKKALEAARNLEKPFDSASASKPIDQTPWYL